MTILWSAGIVMAGFMARTDMRWLWVFSGCIFLQYVTDMLDGAVGRGVIQGLSNGDFIWIIFWIMFFSPPLLLGTHFYCLHLIYCGQCYV
jgi:hypothetical protein